MPNGDNQHEYNIFTTQFAYTEPHTKTFMGNLTSEQTFYPYNEPKRDGYTFKGFHFSNGSGQKNTSGDKFYFNGGKYGNGTGDNVNTWVFNGDYAGDVTATAIWINWDETEIIIGNEAYNVYIYNGSNWDEYIPYIADNI